MALLESDLLTSEETLETLQREGFELVRDMSQPPSSMIFVFPEKLREMMRKDRGIEVPATIARVENIVQSKPLSNRWLISTQEGYYFWTIDRNGQPQFIDGVNYTTKPDEAKNLHVFADYCLTASPECYEKFFPKKSVPLRTL